MPIGVVPAKKSTFVMVPSLSDADALTAIAAGAVNIAPLAGAVSETIGA